MTQSATGSALVGSDWLLLLLDRVALGADGPDELDPVRLQKGMFLLSKRGPARGIYDFRAYDWGPFSSTIYADLATLTAAGELEESRVPGRTWSTYHVTRRGHEKAQALTTQVSPASVEWLKQAREFLTTRSFGDLLREIYDLYPDYAVKSRFSG